MKSIYKSGLALSALLLSGCAQVFDKHVEYEYVEPEYYPVVRATGYAPIDAQRGQGATAKMLQAMRASKLDAYRELTEQVYGQRIHGDQRLLNLVLQNDQLKASVQGVIRGARVVKTYPVGDDSYATELELDMQQVHAIYISTTKPRRIKQVNYY